MSENQDISWGGEGGEDLLIELNIALKIVSTL